MPPSAVHCLMITGKDEARLRFARRAVADFEGQDYAHKALVIINHHPEPVLTGQRTGVLELQVRRGPEATLGHLRNLALGVVPMGDLWCTWDDDDLRHPSYLSHHVRALQKNAWELVMHSTRIEHNQASGTAWVRRLPEGSWVYVARRLPVFRFFEKNYGEDTAIRLQLREHRVPYGLIDNRDDATLYVRTLHGDNTSLKVDPEQTAPMGPHERALTPREARYLHRRLEAPW